MQRHANAKPGPLQWVLQRYVTVNGAPSRYGIGKDRTPSEGGGAPARGA